MGLMEPLQPKGEEGREPSGQKKELTKFHIHTHAILPSYFCSVVLFWTVLSLFGVLSEAL